MFKVIVHFDGRKYEDGRKSYDEAVGLLNTLNATALKLKFEGIISEYYIELIKEV